MRAYLRFITHSSLTKARNENDNINNDMISKKKELPKTPPSISDYALTRRQFQIFERALQKFKSDVSLWQQYLSVAQRAGARALAGRVAARAVQLHPRTPGLYVLAAAHELAHGGMGAARALLLRGLRLNAGCAELWREYVRLEMGFVESMRRRWDVLGISLDDDDAENDGDGQGGRIDRAEEEAMGDAARREIMGGAIVRQAVDGAAKGEFHVAYVTRNLTSHYLSLGGTLGDCYSVTDDRAVSEPADTYCRIPGTRGPPQLVAGPPACAIDRGPTSRRDCVETTGDTVAGPCVSRRARRRCAGRRLAEGKRGDARHARCRRGRAGHAGRVSRGIRAVCRGVV